MKIIGNYQREIEKLIARLGAKEITLKQFEEQKEILDSLKELQERIEGNDKR